MIKEELQLSDHEERVYNRFCRALVNLPVYFGAKIILLREEENELDKAFDDAYALCEEMEDGEGEVSLDYSQINMLAMIAAANITEQVSPQLLLFDGDGRNFHD